ncbi:unnamed protein product [Phytophthora lilii]|uniref:Unnamed protein product n=1 Tax=Phytophthora lilii TaxID=2077276 RepID=A0A9W6X4I4_9STRA|nr:unnamed protein product [Phytophthora lilii]
MGALLELKIPGLGSVHDVLLKLVQHGDDMKEIYHACLRLHHRLEGILNEVKKMEDSGQVLPSEILDKFVVVLSGSVDCFERYHEKRLAARLVKYQTLMDELRAVNEEIDLLLASLNMTTTIGWKGQWEADQRAQYEVMEPIVLFNRLTEGIMRKNLRSANLPNAQVLDDVVLDQPCCTACNASIRSGQHACSNCGSYLFSVSVTIQPAAITPDLEVSNQQNDRNSPDIRSTNDKMVDSIVETCVSPNNDESEGMESSMEDITQLLEHVRSGNEEEKRVATEELAKLVVSHDEIRAHIVEEGILPPLVHLLRTGTDRQTAWATNALVEVAAMNDGTRAAVVREGAIPPLVALVRDGTEEQKRLATNVLAHLASSNDDVRVEIVREGAIMPLTQLVQSGTDAQKQSAANVLAHLASSNIVFKADIAKQGVIAPLVSLVRTGTDGQKIWSAHALMNLASRNDANRAEILREGAKAPLMMLVRSGTAEQKVWASKAMNKLSSTKAIKAKLRLGIRNFFTGK